MRLAIALCSLSVILSTACGPAAHDSGGGDGPMGGDGADGGARADAWPAYDWPDGGPREACDKMDILFVIDNSGSMGQEQANLAANFPSFISVLESFTNADGEPVDYHVGVTTTGVSKEWEIDTGLPFPIEESQDGEDGHLQTGASCSMPRRWLQRGDAEVSSKFSCIAAVGTGGASDEMPLEGARLALTDRMADSSNAGFLRSDALLALVLLTDEEDCSRPDNHFTLGIGEDLCNTAAPVTQYVSAFDAVAGSRDRWAAAIIAGVGPGACSSDLGNADEAARLIDFAGQVGDNAITSSICQGDLASPLADAMETFQAACNDVEVD
jgi:hypothetical protein